MGVALLVMAPPAGALADEEAPPPTEVYQVHLAIDAPIIALGAVTGLLRKTLASRFVVQSCPCDRGSVNWFDRSAIGNHNPGMATLSDVSVGLAIALPPLLDIFDVGVSKAALEDLTVMTETLMVAIFFQQVSNIAVQRPRPATYAGNPGYVHSDEGYMSFYGGHVSSAVAALAAGAYTLRLRHGEQIWPWLVTAAVGASVAFERVASGNHFPTDVLAGFAAGLAIGLVVPWLHAGNPGTHLALVPGPGDGGLAIAMAF